MLARALLPLPLSAGMPTSTRSSIPMSYRSFASRSAGLLVHTRRHTRASVGAGDDQRRNDLNFIFESTPCIGSSGSEQSEACSMAYIEDKEADGPTVSRTGRIRLYIGLLYVVSSHAIVMVVYHY